MTQLCQSVSSFHSPLCWSFQRRLVASVKEDRETPLGVNLVSASLPRCPIRMTLLTLRDAILSCTVTHPAASDRASSTGKYGDTEVNDRSRISRAVPQEPPATAASCRH